MIAVKDTGCGMDEDVCDRVINPFVQEDMTFTRKRDGLGIGLAVVDSFVKLMGGTLIIDSEPMRGTTVTMTFPLATATEKLEAA